MLDAVPVGNEVYYGNRKYSSIFDLFVGAFLSLENDSGGNVSAAYLHTCAGTLYIGAVSASESDRWNQSFYHCSFFILDHQQKAGTENTFRKNMPV